MAIATNYLFTVCQKLITLLQNTINKFVDILGFLGTGPRCTTR